MKNRVAYFGVFTALALIFSYIETLVPISFGIPGVKLGLANLIIVIALYKIPLREVYVLSIVRVLLSGVLFGNYFSIAYSLAGGLLSLTVMALLKKAGLVRSIRGAGGGYVLAREAGDISVGDVLRALEGKLEPAECAAFHEEDGCAASDGCVTKYVWKKINESINNTVDEIKIDTLIAESKKLDGKLEEKSKACSRS